MKFYLFTVLAAVLSFNLDAQNCDCVAEFKFVKNHIEKNHGGFNKKIKNPDEPAYKAFTQTLQKEIETNPERCVVFLKKYILYLQDHHSGYTGGGITVNENSPAEVEKFIQSDIFRKRETKAVDSLKLLAELKDKKGIEGIYQTTNAGYVVAVIKNKTENRDYAAVILSSQSKLWKKGQVKFELKKVNDTLYDALIYMRNHSLNFEQAEFRNGQLCLNGWSKQKIPGNISGNRGLINFTVLENTTAVLTISSFSAQFLAKFDSAYKEIIPEIKKYPNLIIDVRDNSGGSDMNYKKLMPLIATRPFDSDVMEYFATPDNIKAYAAYDSMILAGDNNNIPPFKDYIAFLSKAEPYSFKSFGGGKPAKINYPVNEGNPKKIAVLYNRNCASSCESFLFEVRNSDKAILVGENSGGYTGYGNVMHIKTPCGNDLAWTTTVYHEQWKYEFVGIPPQHRIPAEEPEWIKYTKQLLEKM